MGREEGGITLEAAMVLPFIMTLLLAFISCMQLLMMEMSLQSGTSDTVKTIASYMYAVKVAVDSEASDRLRESINSVTEPLNRWEELIQPIEELLPDSIKQLIRLQDAVRETTGEAAQYMAARMIEPLLRDSIHSPWIEKENIIITDMTIPWIGADNDEYFGIVVQYTMQLKLPFYSRDIVILTEAYERSWIGG